MTRNSSLGLQSLLGRQADPTGQKGNIRWSRVSVIWQAEWLVGSCVIFQLVWEIGMTRLQISVQSWAFGRGPRIRTESRKAFGLTLDVDWGGSTKEGEVVSLGWALSSVQRTIPLGTGPLVQLTLDLQSWDASVWGRWALCSLAFSAEPETRLWCASHRCCSSWKAPDNSSASPQTTQIQPPTFVTS